MYIINQQEDKKMYGVYEYNKNNKELKTICTKNSYTSAFKAMVKAQNKQAEELHAKFGDELGHTGNQFFVAKPEEVAAAYNA
jgi:imidazoleglycerol phosphate synthase glutamine amidotransferase subunit HisH